MMGSRPSPQMFGVCNTVKGGNDSTGVKNTCKAIAMHPNRANIDPMSGNKGLIPPLSRLPLENSTVY